MHNTFSQCWHGTQFSCTTHNFRKIMARSMNFYKMSFHVHTKRAHLNNEMQHRLYSCFGPSTKTIWKILAVSIIIITFQVIIGSTLYRNSSLQPVSHEMIKAFIKLVWWLIIYDHILFGVFHSCDHSRKLCKWSQKT